MKDLIDINAFSMYQINISHIFRYKNNDNTSIAVIKTNKTDYF